MNYLFYILILPLIQISMHLSNFNHGIGTMTIPMNEQRKPLLPSRTALPASFHVKDWS